MKTALVLSGGGARGAYQVGVVHGILSVLRQLNIDHPFQILSGVSAGAINTAYLASRSDHLVAASRDLSSFWGNLHSENVYETGIGSLGKIGFNWALDLVSGDLRKTRSANALLDITPLTNLCRKHINFPRIEKNLKLGHIDAVSVSATAYHSAECHSFFSSNQPVIPWQRKNRVGLQTSIALSHMLASAAIPLLFPPVAIADTWYGDGCIRNTAPLSPAIHLGANRIIAIGVRHSKPQSLGSPHRATSATILSSLINAVLLDGLDTDLERLARINHTLSLIDHNHASDSPLRPIDWLYISPSKSLAEIAISHVDSIPPIIKYLLLGLGPIEDVAPILSYLFFEPCFLNDLLELGFNDALSRAQEIENFFMPERQKPYKAHRVTSQNPLKPLQ